jgi:hypothetical protein
MDGRVVLVVFGSRLIQNAIGLTFTRCRPSASLHDLDLSSFINGDPANATLWDKQVEKNVMFVTQEKAYEIAPISFWTS